MADPERREHEGLSAAPSGAPTAASAEVHPPPESVVGTPLDVDRIKQDFPILARQVHGKRLVYLDNAATSQKPTSVIQALVNYYENSNSNVHRGMHLLAEEATEAYEAVRDKVARFINAEDPGSIVFTRNTTESINLVADGWARHHLKPADEVVLTVMEHHSNIVPWQRIAKETGCELKFADVTDEGELRLDQIEELVGDKTRLVGIGHVSNAMGTINPVRQIAEIAHAHGALVVVDGAQGAPHAPVDVQAMNIDFYAFSGHKACGPSGASALYGRRDLLEEVEPLLGGGHMIRDVTLERSTWAQVPHKFEAGSQNVGDVVGLGAAIDYLSELGMEKVSAHEAWVIEYALERLSELPFIKVYGPPNAAKRCGLVSFTDPDIHPHDVGTVVDRCGVAIRAGHHCTKPLMRRLGVVATARASFYIYNDRSDVDALIDALYEVRKVFGFDDS